MTGKFNSRFLTCKGCGEEFAFTVAAQKYFESRGFHHDPKYCRCCHTAHMRSRRDNERISARRLRNAY